MSSAQGGAVTPLPADGWPESWRPRPTLVERLPAPTATFGEQLRHYRERAGLTQEALAERAGLAAHAVSALERGVRQRPYPHTVRALATALGLAEADRVALAAPPPPNRPPLARWVTGPLTSRGI